MPRYHNALKQPPKLAPTLRPTDGFVSNLFGGAVPLRSPVNGVDIGAYNHQVASAGIDLAGKGAVVAAAIHPALWASAPEIGPIVKAWADGEELLTPGVPPAVARPGAEYDPEFLRNFWRPPPAPKRRKGDGGLEPEPAPAPALPRGGGGLSGGGTVSPDEANLRRG